MKTYIYASEKLAFKSIRIKIESWLKIIITILFLYPSINAQQEIDTLHIFPDTTSFFDQGNGLVLGIYANFAVKFMPDSTWKRYKIENVDLLFFNSGVYLPVYLKISTGNIPEENVLYEKYFVLDSSYSCFPNWHKFILDTSLILSSQLGFSDFFVSGLVFLRVAGSFYSYPIKMNQFYFNAQYNAWDEGLPVFLAAKVVVSKILVGDIKSDQQRDLENLLEIFPNPFNSATTIKYSIANSKFVTIKIYNILGFEVATLVNEEKPAGSFEFNFEASTISSGIYIVQLTAGNFLTTSKMILLK